MYLSSHIYLFSLKLLFLILWLPCSAAGNLYRIGNEVEVRRRRRKKKRRWKSFSLRFGSNNGIKLPRFCSQPFRLYFKFNGMLPLSLFAHFAKSITISSGISTLGAGIPWIACELTRNKRFCLIIHSNRRTIWLTSAARTGASVATETFGVRQCPTARRLMTTVSQR